MHYKLKKMFVTREKKKIVRPSYLAPLAALASTLSSPHSPYLPLRRRVEVTIGAHGFHN